MESFFKAIETMTAGTVIIKGIEIIVIILLICAIFEIAGNSKEIRKNIEKQNEILKEQNERIMKTNLILVKQFTKDNEE